MIKNFLARVGCLTIVALTCVGAWQFRDQISRALGRVDIVAPSEEPSEAVARQAEQKIASLSSATDAEIRLTQVELQSLFTYRIAPWLPDGLEDPIIELQDTLLVLSALVRPEELQEYAPPDVLEQFLSDTARVAATLIPGLRSTGTGQLTVVTVQAGALVIPSLMVPFVLQNIDIPGVDASGADLLFALPQEVSGVHMDGEAITIRMSSTVE